MIASQALLLDSISKHFGGVQALRDVGIEVASGSVHCLVGENGSGKSTLIKIATGALRPDAGMIKVGHQVRTALTPREAIRLGIDAIYQDLSLFPNLTVAENIALPSMLASGRHVFRGRESRRMAVSLLDQVHVALNPDVTVDDLGPAQKQVVAICRALRQDARIIFMDEPTASLTWREVETLFGLVRELTSAGVAVVFVSHKLDEVLNISDRVTVLRNGRVVAQGPTTEFDRAALIRAMTGRCGWGAEVRRAGDDRPPQLEVQGLSSPGLFEDVSFTVRRGEIVGFAGLLGSGASEILSALFGAPPPARGEIRMADRPIVIRQPADAAREGFGYVPNDRLHDGLFIRHSVSTNVVAADIKSITGRAGLIRHGAASTWGASVVDELRIAAPGPDTVVGALSGGNQQKVVLGRWLLRKPKVLLLNGPTIGVDVGAKAEIHRLLGTLAASGTTILVASDDVPEIAAICERVFVMRKGRFVAELKAPAINEAELYRNMVA